MTTDRQILDLIRASDCWESTINRVDKQKIERALRGERTTRPRSFLGAAAWELANRIAGSTPPPPPPPPPPPVGTYVKVAPRVAFKPEGAGASDARFCTVGQPGVVQQAGAPTGHTIDESGATYDENGLCKNGVRSDGPAVTSSHEIDGRDICSLPRMGKPTDNTGSWAI